MSPTCHPAIKDGGGINAKKISVNANKTTDVALGKDQDFYGDEDEDTEDNGYKPF